MKKEFSIRQKFIFNAKDDFLRFLIEKKALEAFLSNLEEANRMPIDVILELPSKYIVHAFFWAETAQGYSFWNHLDYEWRYIRSYKLWGTMRFLYRKSLIETCI